MDIKIEINGDYLTEQVKEVYLAVVRRLSSRFLFARTTLCKNIGYMMLSDGVPGTRFRVICAEVNVYDMASAICEVVPDGYEVDTSVCHVEVRKITTAGKEIDLCQNKSDGK